MNQPITDIKTYFIFAGFDRRDGSGDLDARFVAPDEATAHAIEELLLKNKPTIYDDIVFTAKGLGECYELEMGD